MVEEYCCGGCEKEINLDEDDYFLLTQVKKGVEEDDQHIWCSVECHANTISILCYALQELSDGKTYEQTILGDDV